MKLGMCDCMRARKTQRALSLGHCSVEMILTIIFLDKSEEAAGKRVQLRHWVIQLWEYTGSDLSVKAREANRFHSHDRSGCSCMWTWMQRNLLLLSLHHNPSHPPHFSSSCFPSHFEWSMHPVLHEFPLRHWHGCYSIMENLVWQKFTATWTLFINLSGKRLATEKPMPCVTHREEMMLNTGISFKERYRRNTLFKMRGCWKTYRG